jgi:toxin YhaV
VNDENTLRKAESRTDPYAIFIKRLRGGDPPGDWDGLFWKAATREAAFERRGSDS